MRVLVFHGYLLSGTGSNVYNASLAAALRSMGHEVHLLCQEPRAGELPFVDALGTWDSGELRIEPTAAKPGEGSVTAYRPDIAGLLPVFVRDRYEGFEVKTFGELTDEELERYIDLNVRAVRDVVEGTGDPDAALANHLVMGPVIMARAGLRFAVKVHGSDLSYTILPELERFGPYAREGARAAAGILVGSGHIADRLREAVDDPAVQAKVSHGPPGVDTRLFAPIEPDAATRRLRALARELQAVEPSGRAGASSWDRDPLEGARAVAWLADGDGPRVLFVGKLIASKGVDLLLAGWPLVHAEHPGAQLLLAGFGAFREGLERLWGALEAGDVEDALAVARAGRSLEGGPEEPLRHLTAFLRAQGDDYRSASRDAAGSVAFAGRLEYTEVGQLVPAVDALVFPSTHPEAFGMVAAEAASAGVLPVSSAHSGSLEVSRALAAGLDDDVAQLLSFEVADDAPTQIAARIRAWLTLDPERRERARQRLSATAQELWSWESVAGRVIGSSRAQD